MKTSAESKTEKYMERCVLCGQPKSIDNPSEPRATQIVHDMKACPVCNQNRPFPERPGRWELYVGWPQSEWRPVTVKKGPTGQLIVVDDADESKTIELEKIGMASRWRKL
jgi:hypothetical protein